MSRVPGVFPISVNYEVNIAEALDARSRVSLQADLIAGEIPYPYNGMTVTVYGDSDPLKNGTYWLRDAANVTNIASWKRLDSPETTDELEEGIVNLYFTPARARSSVSVVGDFLQYNNTTGVLSTAYTPENAANKGVAGGYVPLNISGKINTSYLPDSVLGNLRYGGTYNGTVISANMDMFPELNGVDLPSSAGYTGVYFISTANFTRTGVDYVVGDWVVHNGAGVYVKVDNSDAITSFNGRIGPITLVSGDVTDALAFTPISNLRTITINGVGYDLTANRAWTLTTADIGEAGGYLYYTDLRARAALSFAAGSGSYNSTTGVITIPTDTIHLANSAGYLTSYSETDTLASVTGRGSSTSVALALNGGFTAASGVINGAFTIQPVGDATMTVRANTSANTARILFNNGASSIWALFKDSTVADFRLYNYNLSSFAMTVSVATNAFTFGSSLTASSFIRSGGTSAQFLKADGSVDSSSYITAAALSGYATESWVNTALTNYYTTTQIQNFFSGASAMTGYNKSNWDIAFGWGNHAGLYLPIANVSGTINRIPKFTSSSAIGNSQIFDNGSEVGIGTTTPTVGYRLNVVGLQRNIGANTVLNFGELDANNIYFQALNLAGDTAKGIIFYGTSEYGRFTNTGALSLLSSVTATNFIGPGTGLTGIASALSIGGNAATATTFSTNRTNYRLVTDGAVVGQLMWKEYGNNHTIFDASDGTAPDGTIVDTQNSAVPWAGTYPTLMGWNGATTYGVRVDSARLADNSALLQGYSAVVAANANTVALRDGNGYLRAVYFYDDNASIGSSGITSIYGGNGDRYMYKYNQTSVRTFLGLASAAYIDASQSAVVNTVAQRTSEADIFVRLLRTEWTGGEAGTGGYILMQNAIGAGAVDNYARPTSMTTLRGYMGLGDSDSTYMRYQGFTLDANTMLENRTGFTYAANAPYSGPILYVGAAGYGLQFNATYSGGGEGLAYRTRNGDNGTWNGWNNIWHEGNFTPGSYVPYTGATQSLIMGSWSIASYAINSDRYYRENGSPMLTASTNYNTLYTQAANVGIFLGGAGDPANYYDNTTHYFRSIGGGSTYASMQNGASTFYGLVDAYNIDNVNRTTYRDVIYVTANAPTLPYNGHGGGILFRGSTYQQSGSNVAYARIGTVINSNSVDTFGSTLFIDIASNSSGSMGRAFELYYTGRTKWFYNAEINGSDRVLELKGLGGGNNALLRYSDGSTAKYSTGFNNGEYIIYDDVAGAYRMRVAGAVVAIHSGTSLDVQNGRTNLSYTSPGLSYNQASLEVYSSGSYGPRISLHYGGVVASQISVESSGRVAIINNPGTSYEAFVAGAITSTSDFVASTHGTFGGRTRVGGGYITDLGGTGNHSGIAFGSSGIYSVDGNGSYSSTKDLGYDSLPWRSAYLSGAIRRTNPLGGYLNGGYAGVETTTTPGLIYAISDSYIPTASTLGTMYGVGYTHGSFAGDPMSSGGTWGFYVAAAGTMHHRFGQEAYRSNVPIINTSSSASNFSGALVANGLYSNGGYNVVLAAGDLYINNNSGYGILSQDGSRAIAITNSGVTVNDSLTVASGNIYGESVNSHLRLDNSVGARLAYTNHFYQADSDGLGLYTGGSRWLWVRTTGNIETPSNGVFSAGYFDAIYGSSNGAYNGSFDWNVLQLGNNGPNYIVAGHNVVGGWLDFHVNNTNRVPGTTPNGIHAMRIDPDGTFRSYVANILYNSVQSPNHSDIGLSYNVNLGSGGSEGRGLVAGYSGGSYAGIGYNVRHTSSSATWTAPGGDYATYILFNQGFTFHTDFGGAAGRNISFTTLARIDNAGGFTSRGGLFPGYNNAASGEQASYFLYGNTANQGVRTNGNFLVNSDIYSGTLGVWLSSWLNQALLTTSAPTFTDVYASTGWFRNLTSSAGLYNQANNTHFYSSSNFQWDFASAATSYIQIGLRPSGHGTAAGGFIYADTGANIGFLNASGSWSLRMDNSKNAFFYNYLYMNADYGQSLVGLYNSGVFQGIYAMGDSYKLPIGGATPGSLYGLAWAHPNAGGQASNLSTHGLLVMVNGLTVAAISSNIWISGSMTATNFYGIASQVTVNYNNDSASNYQMLWGSGNSVYGTAGIYCNPNTDWIYAARFSETSDSRLKELITENILVAGIENITPHLYRKKGAIELGYYAQEVQPYLSHAVSVGADGKLTLTYRDVFAAKIYSVELRTKSIETEVEGLKKRVTELERKLLKYENIN